MKTHTFPTSKTTAELSRIFQKTGCNWSVAYQNGKKELAVSHPTKEIALFDLLAIARKVA